MLLADDAAICDVMRAEVLASARDEQQLVGLRRLLAHAVVLPIRAEDYEDAARRYRQCRQRGETVRKLIDCPIAAVAIREDVPVLRRDADFDALARHTGLQNAGH